MSNLQFTVDAGKCTRCQQCAKDCPSGIIEMSDIPFVTAEAEQEGCLECQHCLAVCPSAAVSVFGLDPADSFTYGTDKIPTYEQVKTFVRGRRSVRQFQDKDVDRKLIDQLLTDTAYAPTGCNDRDLTFAVVDNRAELHKFIEIAVSTIESYQARGEEMSGYLCDIVNNYRQNNIDDLFRGAPHVIIVYPGENAHTGVEDAVIALSYFEILAQCHGLGTTWCGYLRMLVNHFPELRKPLHLPEVNPDNCSGYFYAMMFGYPAVHYKRTIQLDNVAKVQRLTF